MNVENMSTKSLLFACENLFNLAERQTKVPFKIMGELIPGKNTSPATNFGLAMALFEPMYKELKKREIPVPDQVEEFYKVYREEMDKVGKEFMI